jgi:hypothetical protein
MHLEDCSSVIYSSVLIDDKQYRGVPATGQDAEQRDA